MKALRYILLLFIFIQIVGCISFSIVESDLVIGEIRFLTDEAEDELYLFGQGFDFGRIPHIDTLENHEDSTLIVGLSMVNLESTEQFYDFIVKKSGVTEAVAQANLILDSETNELIIDQILGNFEIVPHDDFIFVKVSVNSV